MSQARFRSEDAQSQSAPAFDRIDEERRVPASLVAPRAHSETPPSNPLSSPAWDAFGDVPVRGDPGGGLILGEATPHTSELVVDLAVEEISGDRPWSLEVAYPPSTLGPARVVPPGRATFEVDRQEDGKFVVNSGSPGLRPHPSRRVVSRSDGSGEALLCRPGASILHVGRFAIPVSQHGALEDQNLPLDLALDVPIDEAPGARPCVAFARFSARVVPAVRSEPVRR